MLYKAQQPEQWSLLFGTGSDVSFDGFWNSGIEKEHPRLYNMLQTLFPMAATLDQSSIPGVRQLSNPFLNRGQMVRLLLGNLGRDEGCGSKPLQRKQIVPIVTPF